MKKVIFIGGTSRSGSTLLDLMLSNDEKIMSLGEIESLFNPTRKHHFEEIEKLKNDTKWSQILKGGKQELFNNIFKEFKDIDAVVDSSKNPFWFLYHTNNSSGNYEVSNVLVHKSPQELANSYLKRGRQTAWIATYEKYHRKYLSLMDSFLGVTYKDIITDDSYLEKLCNKLGIDYFKDKKKYWEKEQHNFFGSFVTRGHDSKDNPDKRTRKDLKYDGIKPEYLDYVNSKLKAHPNLERIEKQLLKHDITANSPVTKDKGLMFSSLYVVLLKLKYDWVNFYRYYFPKEIRKPK